jgi:hypothetical protein
VPIRELKKSNHVLGGPPMEMPMNSFVELTDKALPEEDVDKFIEYLSERERYRGSLMDSLLHFTKEEAQTLLARETRVLEKLQEERAKLLKEMESINRDRKASAAYTSRPARPAPVFLNKTT